MDIISHTAGGFGAGARRFNDSAREFSYFSQARALAE